MARLQARFRPEDVAAVRNSLRVIEDRVRRLSTDDVEDVANWGVAYIRDIFPKAKGTRRTALDGDRFVNRGTPLWRGWRKYMTASAQGSGFMIKHSRENLPRVATILASLDQGSKAYRLFLRRGQFFTFLGDNGQTVIRSGGKNGTTYIRIPAKPPTPTPQGYVRPTWEFIRDQIIWLTEQRRQEMMRIWERKEGRLRMLRERHAALLSRRQTGDE